MPRALTGSCSRRGVVAAEGIPPSSNLLQGNQSEQTQQHHVGDLAEQPADRDVTCARGPREGEPEYDNCIDTVNYSENKRLLGEIKNGTSNVIHTRNEYSE